MKNATAVKERPILFSGPMIRAILRDRKTQTRRAVNPQPWQEPDGALGWRSKGDYIEWNNGRGDLSPYGVPGDRLWVRETWVPTSSEKSCVYRTDFTDRIGHFWPSIAADPKDVTWKPSIFMPRWASRITLEITEVRVQRVQEISPDDIVAEGIPKHLNADTEYIRLWDFLNAKRGYSWASNPWVWAIGFKRVTI